MISDVLNSTRLDKDYVQGIGYINENFGIVEIGKDFDFGAGQCEDHVYVSRT